MNIKVETHVTKNYVFVIVRDVWCGRRNRFTTHQIGRNGLNSTKVVGRELTLAHSRRIVRGS